MRTNSFLNFRQAYADILRSFRVAPTVLTDTWQGVSTQNKPEMATYEIEDYFFQFPIGTWDLDYHRAQIGPNLPWADQHFELDRVCGEPLNPGKTWQDWPWSNKADGFRTINEIEIDERDWSYLAAMIDGDGSITFHRRNSPESTVRPRISISQKDHSFIRELHRRFPFAHVHFGRRRTIELKNHSYETNPGIWFISRKADVLFTLKHLAPYLILKKEKALEAIKLLEGKKEHHSDGQPETRLKEPLFNHSYAERYWPKLAAGATSVRKGIRYEYGDLGDVVNLLVRNPLTRNAYLPVWGFEDTGVLHGGRTPCSLGYLFRMRGDRLSISYDIRSCDVKRHFQDDVYLTVRLLLWVLQQCRELDDRWRKVKPGNFTMHIGSFHLFKNDYQVMFGAQP